MRLGARIVIFVLLASVAPLVLIALATSQVARGQVEASIVRSQISMVEAIAGEIGRQLLDTERVLALQLSNFELEPAPDEARAAFLLATFRLFPEISVAVLVDPDGVDLAPAVYQPDAGPTLYEGHDRVSEERVAKLRSALPAARARGGIATGRAYVPDPSGIGVVPLLLTKGRQAGIALGVELSLASVEARLAAHAGADRELTLFTTTGDTLVRAGQQAGLVEHRHFRALVDSGSASVRYESGLGVDVLAASARVPDRAWIVAVGEPAARVSEATRQIRNRTAYIGGFSLLFSIVAGALFARFITEPILAIRDAATALGQGDFRRRVDTAASGELAELADAFNRMSVSLETNAAEIATKNAQIEAFNRELQERVDKATAQLREAQARLVQSGQLAAVAELSAGLAHELNNPLAGILGLVQLTSVRLAGRPEEDLLRAAEKEALRCKEIVANLLRFTRGRPDAGARDVVDMERVLRDVLALVGGPFRQREVQVEHQTHSAPLLMRGDATLLGRAMSQLLTSLRSIAAAGSTLRISGSAVDGTIVYRFELDGTTGDHDDWRAAGMGFWVARQVFQEHKATLAEPVGERGGPRSWQLVAPATDAPEGA